MGHSGVEIFGIIFGRLFFQQNQHLRCDPLTKGGKAIDGDTFRYKGQRYRIQQYNTPELGQPGSRKATRDLQRKLDSGKYKWSPVTKDVYGRTIVKEKEK